MITKPVWTNGRYVVYMVKGFSWRRGSRFVTWSPFVLQYRRNVRIKDNPLKFKWVSLDNPPKRRGVW